MVYNTYNSFKTFATLRQKCDRITNLEGKKKKKKKKEKKVVRMVAPHILCSSNIEISLARRGIFRPPHPNFLFFLFLFAYLFLSTFPFFSFHREMIIKKFLSFKCEY